MTTNAFLLSPWRLDEAIPEAIRLAQPDWTISDAWITKAEPLARVAQVHEPLIGLVEEAVKRGERPVSVVGDCSQGIAVMAGLQRAGHDPLLVWLDAHGDFNTWETSPSGFIPGMPLAMLVGRGDQTLVRAAGARNLPETDVILVGGRDLDPGERLALESSLVRHVPSPEDALAALPSGRPVYVHFDTDIVDPADAPAVQFPAPGGPSLAAVRAMCRQLADTGRIAGVSMTLWNFAKDPEARTERACLAALGDLVSG